MSAGGKTPEQIEREYEEACWRAIERDDIEAFDNAKWAYEAAIAKRAGGRA